MQQYKKQNKYGKRMGTSERNITKRRETQQNIKQLKNYTHIFSDAKIKTQQQQKIIIKIMKKERQTPKLQQLKPTHIDACAFLVLKLPQENKQNEQKITEGQEQPEQQKYTNAKHVKYISGKQKPINTQSKQTGMWNNSETRIRYAKNLPKHRLQRDI